MPKKQIGSEGRKGIVEKDLKSEEKREERR